MTTVIVEATVKHGDGRIALGIANIVHASVSDHASLEFSNPCQKNRVGSSDLLSYVGRAEFVSLSDRY